MINGKTIQTNNLNSPEDLDLLMFMLENHPLDAPVAPFINQIERERPGVYTMVLRFQEVSANCVIVGKRIGDDIAERIRLAIEKNHRDLLPKARRYKSLWMDEMSEVLALRRSYQQQMAGVKCPDTIAHIRAGCEKAVEEKMSEIRQRTVRLRNEAFPLFKQGESWPQLVNTVLYRFESH